MKLAFYKVNNSLNYERHTFDNIYDKPQEIEKMLLPLLDKDEAAIVNVEDKESLDYFVEEYNDEIYDGGWWCVLINDYEEDELAMWIVSYVGLSDSEYNANGYCETAVFDNYHKAKRKFEEWKKAEMDNCRDEGREFEILQDEGEDFRMAWSGYGEQIRLHIRKVLKNDVKM